MVENVNRPRRKIAPNSPSLVPVPSHATTPAITPVTPSRVVRRISPRGIDPTAAPAKRSYGYRVTSTPTSTSPSAVAHSCTADTVFRLRKSISLGLAPMSSLRSSLPPNWLNSLNESVIDSAVGRYATSSAGTSGAGVGVIGPPDAAIWRVARRVRKSTGSHEAPTSVCNVAINIASVDGKIMVVAWKAPGSPRWKAAAPGIDGTATWGKSVPIEAT